MLLILGAVGAGIGLAGGLAFNLRLARTLGTPLAAALARRPTVASLLSALLLVGAVAVLARDRARAAAP